MSSLSNLYPNLPGMLIDFKDGGSALRFNDVEANTDSLLLLGTAIDGPLMEPVAVDIETAEIVFGKDYNINGIPNGATLVHAFKQAYEAGCQDIRLMRVTGSTASAKIESKKASVVSRERIDKNEIAYIYGNDETLVELNIPDGFEIKENNLKVYAKGKKLDKNTYTYAAGVVDIAPNVCDAGVTVEVKGVCAKQNECKELLEVAQVSNGKIGVFLTAPATEIKSVKFPDDTTDPGNIIPGAEVTYRLMSNKTSLIVTNASANIGDLIEVIYESEETVNVNAKVLSESGVQEIVISETPIDEDTEPVVYVDNAKVLDTDSYYLKDDGRTLVIYKDKFKMNSLLSASYFITQNQEETSSITIESYFAGNVYNEGTVKVEDYKNSDGIVIGKKVTITKPSSKLGSGEGPQVYTSIDYPTFGLLAEAISANNGTYKATTLDEDELTVNLVNADLYFSDGDDGLDLTKDEMFNALSGVRDSDGYIIQQGAYQILENYQVDEVVPLGVYADDELSDKYASFAYELALFCAICSTKTKTTLGGISMKPLKDTSLASVQKHVKYLQKFNNVYYMKDETGVPITDSDGNYFDLGKYITVVAGPTPTFNHVSAALKNGDPATMYMAFATTLPSKSAPTNKRLIGSTGLKFNFSNAQLNSIVGNRMVTFQTKYSSTGKLISGAYIVDAPTAATRTSEYTRLSTIRVIRDVADSLREVADPYIGEANTTEGRNSLSTAIAKRLDQLVEHGTVISYSYNLVSDATQQTLGEASLEVGIQAPSELRKITTVIGLKH